MGHDAPSTSFASSLLSGPFGVGDIGARRLAPSENAADCVARLHSAIKDKDLPSMGELLLELADCYISTVASSPESMVSAARVVHEAAKLELVTQGKQSKGALKKGKKGAAGVGPTASVASVLLPSLGGAPAGAEKPAKQAEASRLGGADGPASGVAPSNNQHEEAKETVGPAEGSSTREPTEQAGKDEPPAEKTGSEMEARESVMKERKIVPKKRIRRFTSVGEEGSRTKLAGNKRLSSEMDEDELPSRDASLATFEIGSTSGGKDTSGGSSSRADEASSELGPTLKTTPASSHGASSSGARLPGSSQGGAARDDWQNLSQTLMPLANGKVASNDPLWGLASSLVAQEHTIPMTARAIFKAFSGLVMAICHTPEGKSNKNLSAEVYAALTETAVEVLHILKGQKLLAFALRFLGAIFPPKSNSSSGVGALGGAANKGAKAAAKVAAPAPKVATPMKVAGTPPATATTPAKSSPAVIASGVPADYVHSMSITAPLKALMGGAALPSPLQNLASGSPSSMALKARGIRAVAAVAFAATAPVVAEKAVKAIVNSLNSQQPELVSTGEGRARTSQ